MQRLSEELDAHIARQNENDLMLQDLKHQLLDDRPSRDLDENEVDLDFVSMLSGDSSVENGLGF